VILWDACGNRLLVVVEPADDERLRTAHHVAKHCFVDGRRIADGVAWFAPRDGHYRTAFFNPDGSIERLCGNSLLVAAAALASQVRAKVCPFDYSDVDVHAPARVEASASIPVDEAVRDESLHGPIFDTGSPHLVIQRENVAGAELEKLALPLLESLEVNVTLYALNGDVATVRTFERGVNAETMACGTGALAVALAVGRPVEIRYPGGTYAAGAERRDGAFHWKLSTDGARVRRCPKPT
jgi:diaminopimelate epimerase